MHLASDDLIIKSVSNWDILNLGALLYARDLKQFKDLKRKSVRVISYKEDSRINALKEQEVGNGYA
jgi:ATP-dependent DNA helicase RecG